MKLLKLFSLGFVFSITSLFLVIARPGFHKSTLTTPDRMIIDHAGYPREMEVAKNEIHLQSKHRIRRGPNTIFPNKATAEEVRQYAQSHDRSKKYKLYLVLYEKGKAHIERNRCVLSDEILVKTIPGRTIPQSFPNTYDITIRKPAGHLPSNFYLFVVRRTGTALAVAQALRANKELILSAEPLLSQLDEVNVMPNDPRINDQVHLNNTGQSGGTPGIDCNVSSVWGNPYGFPGSILGRNIRIGIVDSGVELNHPDLDPNIDIINDYDFADDDNNPNPRFNGSSANFHGTAVAGLAGAQGNNNLLVSGTAPEATLVAMRRPLLGVPSTFPFTSDIEAGALNWKSDIIQIQNHSYGPISFFRGLDLQVRSALEWGSLYGRQGKGTIHVWSAGNSAISGDNANYKGHAKSIYTIPIGAVTHNGQKSSYSNPGACLVISAPVDAGSYSSITTDISGTDGYNAGDYTTFSGTSAAAPMVAGVVALILERNTNLGWRDVKEILISSAKKNDALDSDWVTNTANYHFNHKYGAGLVDAGAAVALAGTWTNLSQQKTRVAFAATLPAAIPDNDGLGITQTFNLNTQANLRVEHVAVEVAISHPRAGDINLEIISPSGITSTLAKATTLISDSFPAEWEFTTVRNWGENSHGIWTLRVADLIAGNAGQLNSAKLTIYGTSKLLPGDPAEPAEVPPVVPPPLPPGDLLPGTKQNQVITIQAVPQKTYGDSSFAINATASSGLPVTLQKVSGPITLSGNTITITGAGLATISASQAGNINWNPAPTINYNFNIAKANQVITIQPVPPKTCGDPAFLINATASSGLPVTLQVVSGPITLSGNTATITGWGSVTISASQAGNINWNPALSVNHNFNIAPPATVPFHRYYSDTITDHFYTINPAGEILTGYNYEGIEAYIVANQVPGTVPLYRYYSPAIPGQWGDHHYTIDPIGDIDADWQYEFPVGFVCATQLPGTIPMHRYWNPTIGDHFLTTSFSDLSGLGYEYEGVRFFVFP